VACVDRSDNHNVWVFDVASGAGRSQKGDTNRIFDLVFSKDGSSFVTVGAKHIKFWDPNTLESQKGIFGGAGEATSFACAAYGDDGTCYTGGANSLIYVWSGR
jgi:WD40 repeat protein